MWINGGYFIFRPEIFDYIEPGEELVEEPFRRLDRRGPADAYRYDGFWAPMDTLKDVERLEALYEAGRAAVGAWWRTRRRTTALTPDRAPRACRPTAPLAAAGARGASGRHRDRRRRHDPPPGRASEPGLRRCAGSCFSGAGRAGRGGRRRAPRRPAPGAGARGPVLGRPRRLPSRTTGAAVKDALRGARRALARTRPRRIATTTPTRIIASLARARLAARAATT